MNNLVLLDNKNPVTTSLIIAEGVKKDHASICKLIRNYEKELNLFGTFGFQIQKSGGRPTELFLLNEEQVTFLITCMRNNKEVIDFKVKIVKEFYKMKKFITNLGSEERLKLRQQGKEARRIETDTIEKFRQYAINQGSKTFDKFIYLNLSKMENRALFIIEQKFPNIRELLTGYQIGIAMTADIAIEQALKDGMEAGLGYKEIYELAKKRVETLASVIPKSHVPMLPDASKTLAVK